MSRAMLAVAVGAAVGVAVAALAGCGAHPRFADRAILWHDLDDLPVAVPKSRPEPGPTRWYTGATDGVFRPAHRFLSVDYGLEAVNVNAVDEVPDSTWYEDRRRDPADPFGRPRHFALADIERGALSDASPMPPFTIRRTLVGGSAAGFVVDDARGRRYAMKFDPLDHVGLVTASDVVASRLAWASGWNVPENEIVDVEPAQFVVAGDAKTVDRLGNTSRLDPGEVAALFSRSARAPDGRWRAVASRWLPGKILGPFTWLGRERSDGNDRYDHENRRDLRGFGVWAAWVDDVDAMEANTLDSYVGAPGHGHVVHYQLDVGGSFGAFSAQAAQYWMGDQSYFQADRLLASLGGAGVIPHRWESRDWQLRRAAILEAYPEFGGFAGEHFKPRKWRPIADVPPFVRMTERDRYWGAKRIAAFSDEELRGAVAAGQYRLEAAEWLFQSLAARRDAIARDGFSRVAPLDYFHVDKGRLCFTDWWVLAGLGGGGATDYRAREHGAIVDVVHGSLRDGNVCVTIGNARGYRIVELAALRPGERHFGPAVEVHLADGNRPDHVIGVVR